MELENINKFIITFRLQAKLSKTTHTYVQCKGCFFQVSMNWIRICLAEASSDTAHIKPKPSPFTGPTICNYND